MIAVREEVADLAGVSTDYYTQLERGEASELAFVTLPAVAVDWAASRFRCPYPTTSAMIGRHLASGS